MDFSALTSLLSKVRADYADLRYEIKKEVQIVFNGPELTQISATTTDGYVLRVLKNGGLPNCVFTQEKDGVMAIRKAEENALLIGRHIGVPVRLARTEVVRDTFSPILDEDPRTVDMEEKLAITRCYNQRALQRKNRHHPNSISGSGAGKIFSRTEGSQIREGSGDHPVGRHHHQPGGHPDPDGPGGHGREFRLCPAPKPGSLV